MPPQVSWGQMFLHPVLLQKCTKRIQRSLTLPVFLDPYWFRSCCLHRRASERPHLWKHDHATDVPVSSIIQHREMISRTEMKTDWDFVNLRLCCICHYEHCFFSPSTKKSIQLILNLKRFFFWVFCHIHNLTHPSAHTPGVVGSWHCGARGAVVGSVPCSRVSPQSWTIPAWAEIRTHNLGLQIRRSIHLAMTAPQFRAVMAAQD